ncbi:hypothetical protein Tco_1298610 [Tanacetum coccineum]
MSPERKAGVVAKIRTQFDLRPHMESDRWPQIYAGIQQHLQKIYNGKKAALKERYWIPDSDGTYDLPKINKTLYVGGVFLNPVDKALYVKDKMLRLQGLGSNTPSGVPYTEDEIMAIARGVIPPSPPCTHSSNVATLKKREKLLTKKMNMFMKLFRSDDKFSQIELQPKYGGGNGSGGCEDDEPGDDEDGGKDEEDEDDS